MSPQAAAVAQLAAALRATALGWSFSDIRMWQTAAFRPGDQSWTLDGVWARGDHLGLVLIPSARDGAPQELEVEAPSGLALRAGVLTLADAQGMAFGDLLVARKGEQYLVFRGERERLWPRDGRPALTLSP